MYQNRLANQITPQWYCAAYIGTVYETDNGVDVPPPPNPGDDGDNN
jgi:hypothetical protein